MKNLSRTFAFLLWWLTQMALQALPCSAPACFTVTSTTDDGTGSTSGTLSWAIAQAESCGSGSEVNFNLTYPATLTLSGHSYAVRPHFD